MTRRQSTIWEWRGHITELDDLWAAVSGKKHNRRYVFPDRAAFMRTVRQMQKRGSLTVVDLREANPPVGQVILWGRDP